LQALHSLNCPACPSFAPHDASAHVRKPRCAAAFAAAARTLFSPPLLRIASPAPMLRCCNTPLRCTRAHTACSGAPTAGGSIGAIIVAACWRLAVNDSSGVTHQSAWRCAVISSAARVTSGARSSSPAGAATAAARLTTMPAAPRRAMARYAAVRYAS
jgi:hypothetical protein